MMVDGGRFTSVGPLHVVLGPRHELGSRTGYGGMLPCYQRSHPLQASFFIDSSLSVCM